MKRRRPRTAVYGGRLRQSSAASGGDGPAYYDLGRLTPSERRQLADLLQRAAEPPILTRDDFLPPKSERACRVCRSPEQLAILARWEWQLRGWPRKSPPDSEELELPS
jgi:hypothetical protein